MRKFLSILGKGIGALLIILLIAAAVIYFKPTSTYEEVAIPELNVDTSPEAVLRGQALVMNNCNGCHHSADGSNLSGRLFEDKAANSQFGTIYTSNLTQHPTAGIASYTNGELYRLLRTGIKRNHERAIAVMPTWPLASDQDIYDMIAFLKSDHPRVAADETTHPVHEPTFLFKALNTLVFAPLPYQEAYPQKPALSDSVAYGAYQVNNVNLCYYCHSQDITTANALEPTATPGYLAGGFTFPHIEYDLAVPGLIPDGENNMSKWSIEEFVDAVKYGQRAGLPAYKEPMHPFNLLDTAEVRAIHHYLSSLQ